MNRDEKYMKRCLKLASAGLGHVAPNPMVGALIVYEDKIIGEGFHKIFGGAHAEVNAIQHVLEKFPEEVFKDSELFVSLEPCSHFGKTPPCTSKIIDHKFKRVIVGCHDPNKEVQGSGIQKLQENGIEVISGVLEKEARELNKRFFTFHEKKRPYVILKYAQSQDHFISHLQPDESNRWISGKFSRRLVHQWRSEEQAILVGTNTARIDNPALTVREVTGKQPLRIVLDRSLRLPKSLKLFDDSGATLVINASKHEENHQTSFIKISFDENLLENILRYLHSIGVQSMIVEGGSKVLQSFIDTGLWDEARVFTSDKKFGEGIPAPTLIAKLVSSRMIDVDLLEVYLK